VSIWGNEGSSDLLFFSGEKIDLADSTILFFSIEGNIVLSDFLLALRGGRDGNAS